MKEWINVREARIAITGGAGFIGRAIAERLLTEGVREVIVLSRTGVAPPAFEDWRTSGRLKIIRCDIRSRDSVREALVGCDAVFHQAAIRVTQGAREPHLASEIMVKGTFHVVSACADLGVKKVIAASSAIVYGDAATLPIPESHPVQSTTPYAIAKIQNESVLSFYWKHFGLNYTILRYFNVYGPGMTLFGEDIEVLICWLDRLDAGLPPLIFGDGHQTLDWVFIDDVAEANWRALLFQEPGEIFNVCSGTETSLVNLLQTLAKVVKKEVSAEFRPARTVNHVARRLGDPRKAERRLGFRAVTDLEKGLARLVEWRASVTAREMLGTS